MKKLQKRFDDNILNLLKDGKDNPVSGEDISRILDISRTAVWKHIEGLRNAGYEIEAVPAHGYRLISSPDVMTSFEVTNRLTTEYVGRTIHAFSTANSTNTTAFEYALNGAAEGTAVIAEAQKNGRGRLGRRWISASGKNILTSVILRPRISPFQASQITLLAAVAACRAIEEVTGILPDIKWPNDLLIRNRKVAGILMELDSEADMVNFIIIGIGINVNMGLNYLPDDVARTATSLKEETGETISRISLIQSLFRHMEKWYEVFKKKGFEPVLKEWERLSVMTGKNIRVSFLKDTREGMSLGLDTDGALLLRLPSGKIERVLAGDVTLVR